MNTQNQLPAGYQLEHVGKRYYVSWSVNELRYRIREDGKEKYFYHQENAVLYAQLHDREQKRKETENAGE